VPELIELLTQDTHRGQLAKRMQQLCKPKVLILDEMGYLPLERQVATFLFQLVAKRYEKGAIILSSNKSFSEWGELFTDQVLATALLDRLLHHSSIISNSRSIFKSLNNKENLNRYFVKINSSDSFSEG
jgi:DNA replication protein DnaC